MKNILLKTSLGLMVLGVLGGLMFLSSTVTVASYNAPLTFASLLSKPTTLSGYGITDAYPLSGNPSAFLTSIPAQTFASLTSKPTTLSGYGITDAYPLSGNPSSFLTTVPATTPQWIKITKSYTDFSTAGATNTITITTLPAKSVVHTTIVRPATSFTGGIISAYTISVGLISNVDLMPASSSFTVPTNPFASNLTAAGTYGGTQAITATAIAVTGLLNAATQGSVEIDLLVSQTP